MVRYFPIILIFLSVSALFGAGQLSLRLDDSRMDYSASRISEGIPDTRISTGSAIWKTYGYYGIYKTGCVALGMAAAGTASGIFVGGAFTEILGDRYGAQKQVSKGKIILWSGVAAAYGLSFFAPKIVAHNLRQDDPNAPYEDILESGLISEAVCNAAGIGFLALGWSIEEGFWSKALVTAGFLCFFLPTPTVMHSAYTNYESPSPTSAMNMCFGAMSFGIIDYSDGTRDYSINFDVAKGLHYQ